MCFNLDTTGDITGNIPGVTVQSPMASLTNEKPCSRQIVLKVCGIMHLNYFHSSMY